MVVKNFFRLKRKEEAIAFLSSNLLHTIRCLLPPKAPSRTFFEGKFVCLFLFVSYWLAGCLFLMLGNVSFICNSGEEIFGLPCNSRIYRKLKAGTQKSHP